MTAALFDLPGAEVVDESKLSAGRRLTLRQKHDVEVGRHPYTAGPLHADAARSCGNCFFRTPGSHHGRSYPKCWAFPNLVTRGPASDIRAWWPGCTAHEWGDPKLSPDAARSGPAATAPEPTPMEHCEVCGEPTPTPPLCERHQLEQDDEDAARAYREGRY